MRMFLNEDDDIQAKINMLNSKIAQCNAKLGNLDKEYMQRAKPIKDERTGYFNQLAVLMQTNANKNVKTNNVETNVKNSTSGGDNMNVSGETTNSDISSSYRPSRRGIPLHESGGMVDEMAVLLSESFKSLGDRISYTLDFTECRTHAKHIVIHINSREFGILDSEDKVRDFECFVRDRLSRSRKRYTENEISAIVDMFMRILENNVRFSFIFN